MKIKQLGNYFIIQVVNQMIISKSPDVLAVIKFSYNTGFVKPVFFNIKSYTISFFCTIFLSPSFV